MTDTVTGEELAKALGGEIMTGNGDRTLRGCYIGDLLSLAMSNTEEDNVWITVQTNINTVAVATLTDVGAIVICDGYAPDADTLEKAKSEDILIITTEKSAYEAAIEVYKLGGDIA